VTIDPSGAPFVGLAFELYATGEYSLERLADELTARGLRTRPGRYPAGPVSDAKLGEMLRDRYYLGVVTYEGSNTRVAISGRHRLTTTSATGRNGTDYFYFLRSGRQEGVCDLPYLPMEHVEDAVLRYWGSQRLSEGYIQRVRENVQATLDATNASLLLLRERLTAKLANIDRQEENLLDLAADASLDRQRIHGQRER
jgi:site-specific DNA recombinase